METQPEIPEAHKLIWNYVLAEVEKRPEHTSRVAELVAKTGLGESTIKRYIKDYGGKWNPETRDRLLKYIGYNSIQHLKEAHARTIGADVADDPSRKVTGNASKTTSVNLRPDLPPMPLYFVGRADKLDELHEQLTVAAQRRNIVLLRGVGGIGKTTLMQHYLHSDRCAQYFDRIITVTVERNLEDAFITTADDKLNIGVKDLLLQQHKLEKVVSHMKGCDGNNLFVIDNINEADLDDLRRMNIHFTNTGWKFLITTRNAPDGFTLVEVDELDEESAMLLFAYHYVRNCPSREDPAVLKAHIEQKRLKADIIALLDYTLRHTLLLELLAKVGHKKPFEVIDLLRHLQEQDYRNPHLQRTIHVGSHSPRLTDDTLASYITSLFDTDYLFERTGDEHRDSENGQKLQTLRYFSILPHEDTPVHDLKELWNIADTEETEFENRLDELKQVGWLQYKEKQLPASYLYEANYKMHKLVQEVVYHRLEPGIQNCTALMLHLRSLLDSKRTGHQKYQRFARFMIKKLSELHGLSNTPS